MDPLLREAAAQYVLRDPFLEADLLKTAIEALSRGLESPSLLLLAGTIRADEPGELRPLFEEALSELGIELPSRLSAAEILKRSCASSVLAGTLAPREGARRIRDIHHLISDQIPDRSYVGDGFGIARLLGNLYAFDDIPFGHPTAEHELDAALRENCTSIVVSGRDDAG